MNATTTNRGASDTKRLIFFLLKKFAKIGLRWAAWLSLGVIAWILMPPLPPAFMWTLVLCMLGAMSIHTILHRKGVAAGFAKQACRFVFFLSIPMLFVFAGNRIAVWGASEEAENPAQGPAFNVRQGVVPMEEYVELKKLQKEGIKDPKMTKKTVKKFFRKHLKKFKEMDSTAKVVFIVLGVILLVFIFTALFFYLLVAETSDSCLEASSSSDSSCCME